MTSHDKDRLLDLLKDRAQTLMKDETLRNKALAAISIARSKAALQPSNAIGEGVMFFKKAINDLSHITDQNILVGAIEGIAENLAKAKID